MRRRFVYDKKIKKCVEVPIDQPLVPRIQLITDIDQQGKSYASPVTGRMITSRRARKEDLKATGCREVDPSEHTEFLKHKGDNFSFLDR